MEFEYGWAIPKTIKKCATHSLCEVWDFKSSSVQTQN